MGIVYTTLIQDDFNWNYVGKDKKSVLEEIQKEFETAGRAKPELLGEWYGFMVLDCHKTSVWIDEYKEILLKYCDTAHYWDDNDPYNIKKLTQPNNPLEEIANDWKEQAKDLSETHEVERTKPNNPK